MCSEARFGAHNCFLYDTDLKINLLADLCVCVCVCMCVYMFVCDFMFNNRSVTVRLALRC